MRQSRYNVWVERDDGDYVYNGVTGSLLRAPSGGRAAVERVLADPEARDCSPDLLERMAHGRMLVPDEADEIEMLARRYQATRDDDTRFGLTIVTSLGCNFDCPYCFEAKHPSILSDEVVDAVLAALDEQLPRIHTFHAAWFGGEPLVGKRPLLALSDAFIERCDAAGVAYSADISTNGYLLDEAMALELRDRRVVNVQVGLDGPPDIHDRMRPLQNGGETFWKIVENLEQVVDLLPIAVRVNVDTHNIARAEELFQILADRGLSGRMSVYPGQLVGVDDGSGAPSSTYGTTCFTNAGFAEAELTFRALARDYGFSGPYLPQPSGAPCTAVRRNELVVGSEGELYKCWDSVGNPGEVIGSIFDYTQPNNRVRKWLVYDPFTDQECRSCIALPVCMGGCAHHGMDLLLHDNRCSTFRHTYAEQVDTYVELARQQGTPVALGPRPLARAMDTR
jgi:uncharacterized protein